MTFEQWLKLGLDLGFCSEVNCASHNMMMTKEEIKQLDEGWDPCVLAVRVSPDGTA